MQFSQRKMNEERASEIIRWRYEDPYDFYNIKMTKEVLQEFLDEPYIAVVNEEEELVGFFCTGKAARVPVGSLYGVYKEELLDFGLGLKPEFTGQGFGKDFMVFIFECLDHQPLRLTVASFNQRAIRLYANVGFTNSQEFTRGSTKFMTMIKR